MAETLELKLAWTKVALRFRPGPSVSGTHKFVLSTGEQVWYLPGVSVSNDGYTWVLTKARNEVGWVASEYLRFQKGDSVPAQKLIGIHLAGGPAPDDFYGLFERLHKAGRPVPCVLLVAHDDWIAPIKKASPSTFIVNRPWLGDRNPIAEGIRGSDWFKYNAWPSIRNGLGADAHQCVNEWFTHPNTTDAEAQRFAEFYIEMMNEADAVGVRITVGDFAVGHPEPERIPHMARMFAEAEKRGHIVNYHAYSSPNAPYEMAVNAGDFAMRWVPWARAYPRLRFIFGEAGTYDGQGIVNFRDVATTLKMQADFNDMLRPYASQVIGACWWTLGSDFRWQTHDWKTALIGYEAWMKA